MKKTTFIITFLMLSALLFGGCTRTVEIDPTAVNVPTEKGETAEPTVCPGTESFLALFPMEKGGRLWPYPHEGSLFRLLLSAEENGIMAELLKVGADDEIELIYPNAYRICKLKEALVYLDQGCVTEYSFDSFEEALEYAREHIEQSPVIDIVLRQDNNEVGYAFALVENIASLPSTEPDPIGPMWLVWNGMSVRPYTALLYGQSFVENDDGTSGFLHADGAAFFEGILGKVDEMPEVSKDFELNYDRDCSFKYANVYSLETNDRLYENVDLKKLDMLLGVMDEDLIVEIAVYEQGRYIESKDKYEYNVYSCSFILRLGGNEGGSLNKTPSGK